MKEFVNKLIGRLEENSFDMSLKNPDCKAVWTDKAIKIVNELAEEYSADTSQKSANGWIACSERLPSVGLTVLCYWKKDDRYDNTTSYYYTLMHRNEDCQWISDFGMCNGNVIAWQPLPQPYKPQKLEWKDKVMKHFTKTE